MMPHFSTDVPDPAAVIREAAFPLTLMMIMNVFSRLAIRRSFDMVIRFDGTRGIEPLEHIVAWEPGEPPETYPSGI
jgi:hypothetical protein